MSECSGKPVGYYPQIQIQPILRLHGLWIFAGIRPETESSCPPSPQKWALANVAQTASNLAGSLQSFHLIKDSTVVVILPS